MAFIQTYNTSGGGVVNVNGKTIQVPPGASVSIVNDRVYVNGKVWDEGGELKGVVRLEITGDPLNITCPCSVSVSGSVKGNVDAGGSISCGDVGGDVDAGGSVSCGKVAGSIDAGGSVRCSR